MEFDKNRVYTALNADELKVGSEIFAADDLASLKSIVNRDEYLCHLMEVNNAYRAQRFKIKENSISYALAYLVSEPKEKQLTWTDLHIGDVVRKKDGSAIAMVTRIDFTDTDMRIQLGYGWYDDVLLADWEKVEGQAKDE